MLPKDDNLIETTELQAEAGTDHASSLKPWDKRRYAGSLLFNVAAFLLPALYSTLSKLWVANINSSLVVLTDSYTYIGVVVEVLNEGLPRAAWNIIGDQSNRSLRQRHGLSYTLITVQTALGFLMSLAFLGAAHEFANKFLPEDVRAVSLTYVRISAFQALSSTIETAVAAATRALDQPDIPLIISSVKFAVNIILDMLFVSRFHVRGIVPSVNTQATTQLCCNMTASLVGLCYFLAVTYRQRRTVDDDTELRSVKPNFRDLKILARPGSLTFIESAIRNALYLWLVSGIVALGSDYATAWGVFNTIRWGLIMVPVQALEASSLSFGGHAWGAWRRMQCSGLRKPKATRAQLRVLVRPALISCLIALAVEVPMCIFLSVFGARPFAYFISESTAVAVITEKMWRSIDWCYIFYALSTQLATILLATRPRWYLYQSIVSNLGWVLPWAIALSCLHIAMHEAWTFYAIIFGGSLVFSFFDILIFDAVWAWTLLNGRMTLQPLVNTRDT